MIPGSTISMCICSLLCSHVENASVTGETCKSVKFLLWFCSKEYARSELDLLDLDSIEILLATGSPENGAAPKCFFAWTDPLKWSTRLSFATFLQNNNAYSRMPLSDFIFKVSIRNSLSWTEVTGWQIGLEQPKNTPQSTVGIGGERWRTPRSRVLGPLLFTPTAADKRLISCVHRNKRATGKARNLVATNWLADRWCEGTGGSFYVNGRDVQRSKQV